MLDQLALPILAGLAITNVSLLTAIFYRLGQIAAQFKDHERRIGRLEELPATP